MGINYVAGTRGEPIIQCIMDGERVSEWMLPVEETRIVPGASSELGRRELDNRE